MEKVALVSPNTITTQEKGAGSPPSGIRVNLPGLVSLQPPPNVASGAYAGGSSVPGGVTFVEYDVGSFVSGAVDGIGGAGDKGGILGVEKIARIASATTFEPEAADLLGAASGTEVAPFIADSHRPIHIHRRADVCSVVEVGRDLFRVGEQRERSNPLEGHTAGKSDQ